MKCEGIILQLKRVISIIAIVLLGPASFLSVATPQVALADGEPQITGGGSASGLVDSYIPVSGLEVTGDSVDPIPMTITVASGQLSMTTTTGLTFSKGPVGRKLAFTGSKADINAALATLRFRTTQVGSYSMSVELTNPGVVYYPGNGHLYEVVSGNSISWNDAKTAAEARSLNGAQGYLATVTSQAENDYISARLENSGWMGASDSETEGDWKWATGPEIGTSFWLGLGDGTPVSERFSAWAPGEPNDVGGEDCAQYYPEGNWNDLPCDQPWLNRYVVEYGADGDLPIAPSTTTYTISTSLPTPETITVSSCLDLINAASTNQNDNRYDTLTLSQDVDCTGETLPPLFNDVIITEDDELGAIRENLGFRGVFSGNGHTISNLTIESQSTPEDTQPRTGFFAATNGATISNVTFENGTVMGIGGWDSYCSGGVVGEALNSTFDNVSVALNVHGGAGHPSSVGGVVGCLESNNGNSLIQNSDYTGSVTGYNSVGGLVGSIDTFNGGSVTVEGNNSTAELLETDSGSYFGGLVGEIDANDEQDTIMIADNNALAFSVSSYNVGGLIGSLDVEDGAVATIDQNNLVGNMSGGGTVGGVIGNAQVSDGGKVYISNLDLDLDVAATGSGYAGGVLGEMYAEGDSDETKFAIEDLTYSGDVSGAYNVGGIAGVFCADYGDEDAVMRNVLTSGTVSATEYGRAGGLAGETCSGLITDSSSGSNVQGEDDVGGLVGENDDTHIYQSYAAGDVSATVGPAGGDCR